MEDIRAVFRFGGFSIELPLGLGIGDWAVFHGITTEGVGGLRVLSCRFHMSVANLVSELLQVGIRSCLKILIKLWLVVPILDPEINNLQSGTRGGEAKGWSGIELDLLGRNVFPCIEELAMDIEDFHGKAAGLEIAVLFFVSHVDRLVCTKLMLASRPGSPGSLL
jgi:hypothetical protein